MRTIISDMTIIDGAVMVLTTDHPASSYGQPVLLDESTGAVYGACDIVTATCHDNTAAGYVRSMAGVHGLMSDPLVQKFLRLGDRNNA